MLKARFIGNFRNVSIPTHIKIDSINVDKGRGIWRDNIELKCSFIDLNEEEHSRPLSWGYDIETIIDEYWNPVSILEGGKLKEVGPRTLEEVYTFTDPKRGNITLPIATTAHPEPESFAHYFKDKGIKNTSWKICFSPKFNKKMLFLRNLGFFSKEPINVQGQMVSPRAVLLALLNRLPGETRKGPEFRCDLVVVAKGEEAGEKVEYTITQRPVADTGVYLAIGALLLARGQSKEKGVFPPEFVPHELYFRECAKRGLETEVSRKWLL